MLSWGEELACSSAAIPARGRRSYTALGQGHILQGTSPMLQTHPGCRARRTAGTCCSPSCAMSVRTDHLRWMEGSAFPVRPGEVKHLEQGTAAPSRLQLTCSCREAAALLRQASQAKGAASRSIIKLKRCFRGDCGSSQHPVRTVS